MYNYIQLYFSVFAEDMALSLPSVSLFPPALIHGGTLLCNPWKRTYILCSFTQVLHMLFLQKGGCFALSIGFAMTTIRLFLWLYLTKYYIVEKGKLGKAKVIFTCHIKRRRSMLDDIAKLYYTIQSLYRKYFLQHSTNHLILSNLIRCCLASSPGIKES